VIGSAIRIAAVILAVFLHSSDSHAHALAQRYDLPLPLGFFLVAAGAAVAVSFAILALFWRHDAWHDKRAKGREVHGTIPGVIIVLCRTIGVVFLILIVVAGLFGNQSTFKNVAPVSVWVIWWVGFSFLCAFVGNVWILINPWTALFDVTERLARAWVKGLSFRLPYPEWLGAWPACALFLLFAWFELVAPGRDAPRNIAITIVLYFVMTWVGFVMFGRDTWTKSGEVFSVVFELFGRFAPLQFFRDDGWHWAVRPFAAGLLVREPIASSMTAFTVLMLGTVTVDGFMETPLWAAAVEGLIGSQGTGVNSNAYMMLQSALLIAGPLVLAALYLIVVAMMARIARSRIEDLAGLFVLSLVPIAIAYHLAHYFTLLAIAGQFIIPLASDPFGYGWDLFGTTLYRIDIGLVDARFIWYLSVTAIVMGHIIAVWIGHVTAFAKLRDASMARRSQYPMLLLMIGYTILSLWILAQPIVEPAIR
jgi:hypothetical protein